MEGPSGPQLETVHFKSRGSMQDGGKVISLQGTLETEASGQPIRLIGDVVLRNGNEVYLRVSEVDVNVGLAYVRLEDSAIQGFLNRWWLLPTSRPTQNNEYADPALLPMQVEVLEVVRDHGTSEIGGHPIRQLSVRVNEDKMKQLLDRVSAQRGDDHQGSTVSFLESYDAEGTVWIEEDTALLTNVRWNLTSLTDPDTKMMLDLILLNPNAGQEISLPQGALPLVPGMSPISVFLQNIPSPPSSEL